jgi:hypothetical protein
MDLFNDVRKWVKMQAQLSAKRKIKRKQGGYLVLLDGGSAATVNMVDQLSADVQQPVYRADLSQIKSKYIGETEKT